MAGRLVARVAAVAAVLALAGPAARAVELTPNQIQNRRCLNCHDRPAIATMPEADRLSQVARATQPATRPARPGGQAALYVTAATLADSVHARLACVDCHRDAATLPHPQHLGKATCNAACHSQQQGDFARGQHAAAAARNDPKAPTCTTCHGGHDILPRRDRRSRTHPLQIVRICGDCHRTHDLDAQGKPLRHVEDYLDSVHGRSLMKGGLAVSASCSDCHGHHAVLGSQDPQSPVHRTRVAGTCGRCHIGLAETYQSSIHGVKLATGDPLAPSCTGCHTAHGIRRTDSPAFMLDVVSECGHCHDRTHHARQRKTSLYETYRRSYHGQVTELGSTRAARCSDCHGSHDIRRIEAPDSPLNQANRVQVCRRCHPQANASFAQFQPHADYLDGGRYPLLHAVWIYFVVIMSCSFGFFGLHCLLWLVRSLIERVRHGPHPHPPAGAYAIRRFSAIDRVNHLFVIISFFGLTLTGLPLLFAQQEWAKTLAWLLGGVRGAGLLHRFFALILIANLLVHAVCVGRHLRRYGVRKCLFGPTTLLPRWKDAQDLAGMIRWFFRGGPKPRFDRWTYWEKFDYMAEVFGSLVIGLTGLLLWFPQFFAQFLPGWMFNVATIIHGYEALLAIGFIFTIHFFNAHLRLEKFPVDDVIFTGQLSEEEFKHERAEEYERLSRAGQLESLRVAPAPKWFRRAAVVVGIAAMTVGMTLVTLIILAGLEAL